MQQPEQPTRAYADEYPSVQVPVTSEPHTAKNAPLSIIPSRPDVHDARALGEQATERREDQRRRVPEHRSEERSPDDDSVEVLDARTGSEVSDDEPEDARSCRVSADPSLASDPRADADGEREETDHDWRDGRAHVYRRKRDEGCGDADDDADPPTARQPWGSLLTSLPSRACVGAGEGRGG